jgi:hypothetical protein
MHALKKGGDAPLKYAESSAEVAFGLLGAAELTEHFSIGRTQELVEKIIASQEPELAFFTLLRVCVSGPLRIYGPRLAQVIIESCSAEWAYNLLESLAVLNTRDPDQPRNVPGQAPLLDAPQLEALVDVVRRSTEAEWIYHTLRSVFLCGTQKSALIARLAQLGEPKWIQYTLEDVYLLEHDRQTLESSL